MNKLEKDDDNLLRKFLNPEKIEKAPEGFTSKTMTRIQIESQSVMLNTGFFVKNRVPVISALITAGLIIAAIIIPAGKTESLGSTIWKYLLDLEFTLPDFSLPGWLAYAMMGIFLLVFFDRALSAIFHKEKTSKSPRVTY